MTRRSMTRIGAARALRNRAERSHEEVRAVEPAASEEIRAAEPAASEEVQAVEPAASEEIQAVEPAASTVKAEAQPSVPTFTDADWEDQSYCLMAEQAPPLPCPNCGRTGFFGPRALDGQPKFVACRFCGHFQSVGQAPIRLRSVTHNCKNWPEAAGAPYIWWIPMNQEWYVCQYCKRRLAVAGANAFIRGAAVTPPADDPNHPWWKVPQNASYDTYYKLWENWPCTKGRVFL